MKHINLAMATFAMAFAGEVLMNIVCEAQSDDWPQGSAHKVVEFLVKKCRPKDLVLLKFELRQQLAAASVSKNDDPAVLFEQPAATENQLAVLA